MKNILKNILKIALVFVTIAMLNSCEEKEVSYVFDNVSAPSDLNANLVVATDGSKTISVTPTAIAASTFLVYFGDVINEEATILTSGETAENIYEDGEYLLKVIAQGITGLTSEFSSTITVGEEMVVTPAEPTEPETAAPTPTLAEADVISIISDAYTNIELSEINPDWGQTTTLEIVEIESNETYKYGALNYTGIVTNYDTPTDLTGMTYAHYDYWTADVTTLGLKLVNTSEPDGETKEELESVETVVIGEWVSVDILLSEYTTNLSGITQLLFESSGGTVFIDNLYFYKNTTLPTLPIDFESTEIAYNPEGFGGATPTIIANPDTAGNSSAMVLEIYKSEAAEDWAGITMVLDAPIDFSETTTFKVNVWSPIVGSRIILKIENSDNADIKAEVETLTTVASGWEELTFDISTSTLDAFDSANLYDKLVLFPNFGAGNNETYYFDTVEQYIQLPTLPIDFESTDIAYNPSGFGGAVPAIIANPDTVDNSSAAVLEIYKPEGAEDWAGISMILDEPIDFSATTTFKAKVWSPVVGARILLKIENSDNADIKAEVETFTTVASGWEELIFDISASTLNALDTSNIYDKLVLFPNFGSGNDMTYYFDDISLNE